MAKQLVMSASQLTSFESCNRQWWFKKVRRLGEPTRKNDPRTFGDITHAVLERYLLADNLGRDSSGQPVDLYPPGWTQSVDKFGSQEGVVKEISPLEQELIQKLVSKAIEEGIVERLPGREVEAKFYRPVFEHEDGNVFITGFIDVLYRDEVHDHKTSKSTRYLKSVKKLAVDPQMLIYARELLERARERGEPLPDKITLRHNQFVKDPDKPQVRKTSVVVPRISVETFWTSRVVPAAEKMLKVRKIKEWHKTPPPPENSNACNAYGGCPFQSICSGKESVDMYVQRMEKLERRQSRVVKSSESKTGGHVSIAAKLAAKKAKQKAAATKTVEKPKKVTPINGPANPEPEAPTPTATEGAPPWAVPGCKACEGRGFNKKDKPCRICDMKSKAKGNQTSGEFTIVVEDGAVLWFNDDSEGSTGSVAGVEAKDRSGDAGPQETAPPDADTATPVTESPEETPKEEPKPKKPKKGRPKKTFTLLVDCVPAKAYEKVHFLDASIKRIGEEMAEHAKVDSYFSINAFDRRDALCKSVPSILEEVGNGTLVATTNNPDEKALLQVLRPLASTVIQGVR